MVAAPVPELVPGAEPVLLDEPREPLQRPVLGVQEQLRAAAELRRAVPAVGAVHQHRPPVLVQLPADGVRGGQQVLDRGQPRLGVRLAQARVVVSDLVEQEGGGGLLGEDGQGCIGGERAPEAVGGCRSGWIGGWRRLPKRLGAVTVGYKCR